MGRKIFITYKYSDSLVLPLNSYYRTTVRNYVDELQNYLEHDDHINKGEEDGTNLSDFKDEYIESKLREKIYDSSVTIVMISKGMKNYYLPEDDQWIPWEILYSLREHTRGGRTSLCNAMLAVTLPDENGKYDYFITENSCTNCQSKLYNTDFLFQILRDNMFNIKEPIYSDCPYHGEYNKIYLGYFSYIYTVKWNDFIQDVNKFIEIACQINENIEDYRITKSIKERYL